MTNLKENNLCEMNATFPEYCYLDIKEIIVCLLK